jgi:hypothetical protein
MRDIETIDSELRLVADLRRAARERGGPLPSIAVMRCSMNAEGWTWLVEVTIFQNLVHLMKRREGSPR